MAPDNGIQAQQQPRVTAELKGLDVFIGKWIDEGYTGEMEDTPAVTILTSDVYEWLPGRSFVLHTAYGRVGDMDVGGMEVLGYDPATKQ